MRRVELTHDVLCPVVGESRDLRHEREARDEAEKQLAAQREREIATHKALLRARKVAAGCAALAIVAIAGAIFGYLSMKRAQEAEAQALQTRTMAESARGEKRAVKASSRCTNWRWARIVWPNSDFQNSAIPPRSTCLYCRRPFPSIPPGLTPPMRQSSSVTTPIGSWPCRPLPPSSLDGTATPWSANG